MRNFEDYLPHIDSLPNADKEELLKLLDQYEKAVERETAQTEFMPFVKAVWPGFIEGKHHKQMAEAFEKVARGELNRVIISMPPRHSKSEMGSYLLPAWFLGMFPEKKIIQASHTSELAVGFGRKVRNLINDERFKKIFPDVQLSADSKAAARWNTSKGGEYFAVGVGGAVAGKGADIFIIDDPISEQEAIHAESNPAIHDNVYEWYTSGPRQRLQPGGSIIIIMCVEENQRVLMANGVWKPIGDISVGDRVAAYDGGKPCFKEVLAKKSQGQDDLLEVVTRSTSLKTNARHPYLVVRGGADKSPVDKGGVRKAQSWRLEWVAANKLHPGDMIVTAKEVPPETPHRPARWGRREQFTQDDYWLFGVLFGDGWLASSEKSGDVGVCVAVGVDGDHEDRIVSVFRERWGVDFAVTRYGYRRTDNRALAAWLRKKGFSSGAKVKRLPDWVFRLLPCDKRAFLRGFFAADGWLRPSKTGVETYTIGLANRELVDDMRLLARTCGVKTTKIHRRRAEYHAPNSPKPIMADCYSARFSFRENQVELAARYRGQSPYGNCKQFFRFERVEEIKPAGKGVVVDITVEGAENFIAEGCVVHNTRWAKRDLAGRVLKASMERGGEEWHYIELPAILPSGEPLWPEFWPIEQLEALRAELPISKWMAQYQQQPTSAAGAILKKEWWNDWVEESPPVCDFIIQSWDTAYTKSQRADFSACTTWGVFQNENPTTGYRTPNLILLDAFAERLEFPELKAKALKMYKDWQPDAFVVEARASGAPLIFELRQMGIPVNEFTPARGNDKIVRANAVADIFSSGIVWAPPTRWAEEVIEQCAEFPAGEHDDLVDSTTQALIRFRKGGFIRTEADYEEEEEDLVHIPGKKYGYF